jgi:hypothetical protein
MEASSKSDISSSLSTLNEEMGKLNLNDNSSVASSKTSSTNKKRKIGFCFDERMLLHRDSKHVHQECPERAMSVYINLVLKDIIKKLVRIPCEEATEEEHLSTAARQSTNCE